MQCQDVATTPLKTADQLRLVVGLDGEWEYEGGKGRDGGARGGELNIAVSDISRRCLEGLGREDGEDGGDGRSRVCRMACEPRLRLELERDPSLDAYAVSEFFSQ